MRKFWYDWGAMIVAFVLAYLCMLLSTNNTDFLWFNPTLITLIGYLSVAFGTALLIVKPFEFLDSLLEDKK